MKIKNKKVIIISILIVLLIAIFLILKVKVIDKMTPGMVYKNSKKTSSDSSEEHAEIPTPDRIIYKNQDGEYMIFEKGTSDFSDIYDELDLSLSKFIDGKVYSEDKISEMQSKESFIEYDYDTISKNYVFMFDEPEIGLIKRLTDSGQVLQTSLKDKEKLVKRLNSLVKSDYLTKYDFDSEYKLTSEVKFKEVETAWNFEKTNTTGVYKKIIKDDKTEYKALLKQLALDNIQEISDVDFSKQDVVFIASLYEVDNIKKNVGNLKYNLGKFHEDYEIDLYIVSKVVNTNCLYFNVSEDQKLLAYAFITKTPYYSSEDQKYYTNLTGNKEEVISLDKAAEIAEEEAKKDIYQYQGWKSVFVARYDENDSVSGELISGLDEISRLYHWNEEWKVKDYTGKLMWKVRLDDLNDPLTSLYVYVDAKTGEIIGAGQSSD